MLKSSFIFAAALFAAASSVPAAAGATVARTVVTGDLNLASAAGRARLDQRIAGAVNDLCGTAAPTDLRGRDEVRQCRVETLAQVSARTR